MIYVVQKPIHLNRANLQYFSNVGCTLCNKAGIFRTNLNWFTASPEPAAVASSKMCQMSAFFDQVNKIPLLEMCLETGTFSLARMEFKRGF